ncbi:site-specific integrase [Clostridia bacterium]|nr:site-specific integrase [Clostridia bacterium]
MARKERNIYKRNDGRYEARYIREYGSDGKAIYGAVYAKTYAEVKEKLERVKETPIEVRANLSQTIKETTENYLTSVKIRIKPSTYGIYQRYLDNYITPYFGTKRLGDITPEILQGFVDTQLKNGLSVVTVQSVFSLLKTGVKSVMGKDNFEVTIPKYSTSEVEFFSLDEQKRLEATAKNSDEIDFIAITMCLYTRLRVGKICGLMWEDIDFECRLLHVRRTMQRISVSDGEHKTKIVFMPPKSATSARSIPLPDFLLTLLREHQAKNASAYVLSRNAEPVEPRNIQYRFKKLLTSAGVKQANFHATRHTFATRALENGFDVKTLSEILGHSSAIVTLKKYAHVLDEHKRNRMEALAVVYQ